LDFTIDDIRDKYRFDETCQETVPQAIQAFLESTSFEDAIRIAISLGGDSDTLAAITGSIAEAYYGVPDILKEQALSYLDHFLLEIYNDWENFLGYQTACEPFHVLTKYIGRFSEGTFIEEWVIDRRNDGTSQRPVHIPYIDYTEMVQLFTKEFFEFADKHPEYELAHFNHILERNKSQWGVDNLKDLKTDELDAECILALMMGAFRMDQFLKGALFLFFKEGFIVKWLKRLKEIDQ